MILGDEAHIFYYEAGGVRVGGISMRTVPNLPDGMLDPAAVEAAIRSPENIHFPRTALICLENTHNRCGGAVLSVEQMSQIRAVANRHGLPVHLDGARIWNAAVALGVEPRCWPPRSTRCRPAFPKAGGGWLGHRGAADFIQEARRNRKIVGGGMRQAGILAAAALVGSKRWWTGCR